MNPGGGGCSELRSRHCTPAWAKRANSEEKKKVERKKKKEENTEIENKQKIEIKSNVDFSKY